MPHGIMGRFVPAGKADLKAFLMRIGHWEPPGFFNVSSRFESVGFAGQLKSGPAAT